MERLLTWAVVLLALLAVWWFVAPHLWGVLALAGQIGEALP